MSSDVTESNIKIVYGVPSTTQYTGRAQQCPVCYGTGHVDAGFYMRTGESWLSAGGTEKCRSCDGKGYVVV